VISAVWHPGAYKSPDFLEEKKPPPFSPSSPSSSSSSSSLSLSLYHSLIQLNLVLILPILPNSPQIPVSFSFKMASVEPETIRTKVLVIGGGLVGLSAGMFLGEYQVPTIVLERHTGSSLHPRAIGFTQRTMENFASSGLTSRIPQPEPAKMTKHVRRVKVESLAGKWHDEALWTPHSANNNKPDNKEQQQPQQQQQQPTMSSSPYSAVAIAQDKLEPLIRQRAIELGAEVRLGAELVDFWQDDSGVTAAVRQRETGQEYRIHAQYMIAADGNRSQVREKLSVGRVGRGHMRTLRSVLFRAPVLDSYLTRGFHQFAIEQEGFSVFLTTYNDGRWVLMFTDDEDRDADTLRAQIHRAAGRTDFEPEIITTGRWELTALINETYTVGRVFLAGDAAHTLPPTRGGWGANTGIDDVHNLAWKLAAVLAGQASPALLDSYDAERRPIGLLRHNQIFLRDDYKADRGDTVYTGTIYSDDAMEFGQLYRSKAVFGLEDSAALLPAKPPAEWAGQPGTRAQHLVLHRDQQTVSTLDLFPKGWTLLTEDSRWADATAQVARDLNIPLRAVQLHSDYTLTEEDAFRRAFGVGATGASLARPDGYIAWRSPDSPADLTNTLTDALRSILFTPAA